MTRGRTSLEWTISELCALISLQNFYARKIPRLLFSLWKYQKCCFHSVKIKNSIVKSCYVEHAACTCKKWKKHSSMGLFVNQRKCIKPENSVFLTLNNLWDRMLFYFLCALHLWNIKKILSQSWTEFHIQHQNMI